MYKVLSGKDDVNYTTWFTLANPREGAASTRSGALNVVRNEGRNDR